MKRIINMPKLSPAKLRAVALVLVAAILIIDVVYHITANLSTDVDTLPASVGSVRQSISGEAYVVRNEIPVYSSMTGYIDYYAENGERVANKSDVAGMYYMSGGTASKIRTVSLFRKTLNVIESALRRRSESTTVELDSQISSIYTGIAQYVRDGNLEAASILKSQLCSLICYRESLDMTIDLYNIQTNVQKNIDSLVGEIGQPVQTVAVSNAGWFYHNCDGYESVVDPTTVMSMTHSELEALFRYQPKQENISVEDDNLDTEDIDEDSASLIYSTPSCIGKIVDSQMMYAVMFADNSVIANFTQGSKYTAIFGTYEASVTLERTVSESSSGKTALIFSCGVVSEEFDYTRIQKIDVVYKEYSGFKLPTNSVRNLDGVNGVFIRRGFIVEYREIVPLYEENGVLIASSVEESGSGKYKLLASNDNVIVRGTDLYVGKILS